jgi:pSer/pThr/pTyr-binding forkhead associated (FHA) protein
VAKELGNRIALYFSEEFPDRLLSGKVINLEAMFGADSKTIWKVGRYPHQVDICINSKEVSRSHCTIFYRPEFDTWYLMDGVFFPENSGEITVGSFQPGHHDASHNGTWIDGRTLGQSHPRETGVIRDGSHILIATPAHKIIVFPTGNDRTFDQNAWNEGLWLPPDTSLRPKPTQPLPQVQTEIEIPLIEEANSAQNSKVFKPAASVNSVDTVWELIYEFGRWFFSTPKTQRDFWYRVMSVSLALIFIVLMKDVFIAIAARLLK